MATETGKIIPFVRKEIVTLKGTNQYSGYNDGQLNNPDHVLEINGGRVDGDLLGIYDRILRKDAHIFSLFQTRKHMILGKSFEILPGSDEKGDIEACDFVKYQIYDHLENFTQDLYELLSALQYGYSVSEYILNSINGRNVIDKIKFKHPNHFSFSEEAKLLWVSKWSDEKQLLPEYKFIIHRHNANDENPYGESLISERLYWLYWFKKNLFQFMVSFIERFGSPIPVFKYPPGTSQEEHDVIDEMMTSIHDQLSVKLPDGVMVNLLEWKSSGNRSVHEKAIDLINKEMSKAIFTKPMVYQLRKRLY